MTNDQCFISHSTLDDGFVRQLREALEGRGITVWTDSRELTAGDSLEARIQAAIRDAGYMIAVLSLNAINSHQVPWEIRYALAHNKKVIPLLLPGIQSSALRLWFDKEPLAIAVSPKPGGLDQALPALLAALGRQLPNDPQPVTEVAAQPLAELVLCLRRPGIETSEGKRRQYAEAELIFYPPAQQSGTREVRSEPFDFIAPIGIIERSDLHWYLESYYAWPVGVFKERARQVEAQLPQWGRALFDAALGQSEAVQVLHAWESTGDWQKRFSVEADAELSKRASEEQRKTARQAATELLTLPWELLHDGRGYLFQGRHKVRVRRRLPNRVAMDIAQSHVPVRILLVSPRPEDEQTGYIDHRISALPLVEAVECLGSLAQVTVLAPPTFPALEQALDQARQKDRPFDVVHFDGHGVYDPEHGLGGLCFENPNDANKLTQRRMTFIDAAKLAAVVRDQRIPLVFLEACQSAKSEEDPTASVAAKLLEQGVTSIVAMSHSVLVESARRFVEAFYQALARGERTGQAMLAGQNALYTDTYRLKVMGAGDLHLQDWFVPVLYQEREDPQLFQHIAPEEAQHHLQQKRRHSEGHLPAAPSHSFIGRSRELLALERLLVHAPYALIRGPGGTGKTALAVECARWLLRSSRFQRVAFISLESYSEPRAMLDSLGRQLLPDYSVAQHPDQAFQPVERALRDAATLIVLDNLESVLPEADQTGQTGQTGQKDQAAPLPLATFAARLLQADPATRILFTSREFLPAPFDHVARRIELGALSQTDAIALTGMVMAEQGIEPQASDPGTTPREIEELIEAVNCHARALVLLARETFRSGVRATTANLRAIMAELHQRHPHDRENSLYASVELSLRRLPAGMREMVAKGLFLFHGGAHLHVLAKVLQTDQEKVGQLAKALIDVGLASSVGIQDGHLQLDPALPAYLHTEKFSPAGSDESLLSRSARARWLASMTQLTGLLYEQYFKDIELCIRLTRLELPNLLAMLAQYEAQLQQDPAKAEQAAGLAGIVEQLLANLDLPRTLARAVALRQRAAHILEEREWSHARFETERLRIERLQGNGDLQAAYRAAQALQQKSLQAGEGAYAGAEYDIAGAHFLLGRVLRMGGAAQDALEPLQESRARFQRLAGKSNRDAERMASVALTESGDCLRVLGQLREAAAAYEQAIKFAEKRGDKRSVATNTLQLGTTRLYQKEYAEALKLYTQVRELFAALNEPASVATAWHQIGRLYRQTKQFDQAEQAYRQGLAIHVQTNLRADEAASLSELGILYNQAGRLEEAVTFFRQAADIYTALGDLRYEGVVRSNLANALIQLHSHDEARRELLRAIECNKPYGHAAEPWTTWNNLHDLEQATGDSQAARAARAQAEAAFLAYRQDGGENHEYSGQLCARMAQALQQGETRAITQQLQQLAARPDLPNELKILIPKLQAILQGERDPALADDPALDFDDAVELCLLLEALTQ